MENKKLDLSFLKVAKKPKTDPNKPPNWEKIIKTKPRELYSSPYPFWE